MDLDIGETRVWRLDSGPNLQPWMMRNDIFFCRKSQRHEASNEEKMRTRNVGMNGVYLLIYAANLSVFDYSVHPQSLT